MLNSRKAHSRLAFVVDRGLELVYSNFLKDNHELRAHHVIAILRGADGADVGVPREILNAITPETE